MTEAELRSRDGPYAGALGKQLAPLEVPIYAAERIQSNRADYGREAVSIQNVRQHIMRALLMANQRKASVIVLKGILADLLHESKIPLTPNRH